MYEWKKQSPLTMKSFHSSQNPANPMIEQISTSIGFAAACKRTWRLNWNPGLKQSKFV